MSENEFFEYYDEEVETKLLQATQMTDKYAMIQRLLEISMDIYMKGYESGYDRGKRSLANSVKNYLSQV